MKEIVFQEISFYFKLDCLTTKMIEEKDFHFVYLSYLFCRNIEQNRRANIDRQSSIEFTISICSFYFSANGNQNDWSNNCLCEYTRLLSILFPCPKWSSSYTVLTNHNRNNITASPTSSPTMKTFFALKNNIVNRLSFVFRLYRFLLLSRKTFIVMKGETTILFRKSNRIIIFEGLMFRKKTLRL